MRLLFVHDHPFYQEDESVYSGGGLPANIWRNYLINFESISVFGRKSRNLKDKKVISSTENVRFNLTDSYSSITSLFLNKNKLKIELLDQINKADIILIRLPSILGFLAGKLALQQGKIIWVEQVGNAKEALGSHGSFLGKVVAPIFDIVNKRLVKNANFVSYVTESQLQINYPAHEDAIKVSISNVNIKNIISKDKLDRDRFFSKSFKIGLIGGFDVQYKGQEVLLKAINKLDENIRKNIEIYFVGKGDFHRFNKLASELCLSENIKFFGSLQSGEEIYDFLKTLSLYVQPSLTEGMPRATIEAMSMGCPVIGSNVGGIPDIVNDKYLHSRGNYNELSSHIKTLYLDRDQLFVEANDSLLKAEPFLHSALMLKRNNFYKEMNEILK
ncbi:hypothetical protein SF1_01670 [Sphingobacterium faecium NBRC 15299]|uniref:glycosyltransferase n=1 Tax=Sphingobacterium faecium TaxID=34087 RepID=UPI000D358990|nr:glycosyltransferase [Sphingobacterium faecium]PTX12476.1 glycosyltransferase involved in cell wall biosynthesis [Sphingobacterium faecium]GEM62185.1 hypothetical protein SF1_01670 [Sphingobacterium faecium NBRC 15299]